MNDEIENIKIEVPEDPEVNPEVYRDVESILFQGFCTISARLNGIVVVWKSLNHHEIQNLKLRFGIQSFDHIDDDFCDAFLAYSTLYFGGQPILPHRDEKLLELKSLWGSRVKSIRNTVIRHIGEVNRRASAAIPLVEAYCMEGRSRYRWLQIKDVGLTHPEITGIQGTQSIGMNWGQMIWRATNLQEDRNEQLERSREESKFIGSCFAGKALQKLYQQDQDRRQKDRQARAIRKEALLRHYCAGEPMEIPSGSTPHGHYIPPKTIKELAQQLERDLKGEKDQHDLIVEQHERTIRENLERRQKELEELREQRGTQPIGILDAEVHYGGKVQKDSKPSNGFNRLDVLDEGQTRFLEKWGYRG